MSFKKFGPDEAADDWSRKLTDIMDEMRNRSFVHYRDSGTWEPAADVYETVEAFRVCVELAGMDHGAVAIECVADRRIVLSGRRDGPRPPGVAGALSVHVLEIDQGPFRREIELPECVDPAGMSITCDRGYLWITLPKSGAK